MACRLLVSLISMRAGSLSLLFLSIRKVEDIGVDVFEAGTAHPGIPKSSGCSLDKRAIVFRRRGRKTAANRQDSEEETEELRAVPVAVDWAGRMGTGCPPQQAPPAPDLS